MGWIRDISSAIGTNKVSIVTHAVTSTFYAGVLLVYNWCTKEVALAEQHAKAIVIAVEDQFDKLKLHDRFQKLENDAVSASQTLSNSMHNKFDGVGEKLKKMEASIESSKLYTEVSDDIKRTHDAITSLDIKGKLQKLEKTIEGSAPGQAIISEIHQDMAKIKLYSTGFHLKTHIKMLNDVLNSNKNAEVDARLAKIAVGLSPKEIETILIPSIVINAMTCCSKEGVQLPGQQHCGHSVDDWQAEYNFPPNSCSLINEYCDYTQGCIGH